MYPGPYYFMSCSLVKGSSDDNTELPPNALVGTLVSSLHRLKDSDNADGGFFVFGDLSVKREGTFRLMFTLYKMADRECIHIASVTSEPFQVHTAKTFPGMAESTFLTRSFSDQGVRLRLRKDSRSITTRKRNNAAADYARHHSVHDQQSQSRDRRTNSLPESDNVTPADRNRASTAAQGGAYFEGAPQQTADYHRGGSGVSYNSGYDFDDAPSAKRQRVVSDEPGQAYGHDYSSVPYSSRSIPQVTSSMGTYSASMSMAPALPPSLPYSSHMGMPRLDTQLNSLSAGPNSAGPNFQSPRQSPGGGYQYPHAPALHNTSSMMFQGAPTSGAPAYLSSPHGEYQGTARSAPQYPGASADVSPRSHPHTYGQPVSSAGTSPPDANYTTSTGPGPLPTYPGAYSSPMNLGQGQLRGHGQTHGHMDHMGPLRMNGNSASNHVGGLNHSGLFPLDDGSDKHNHGPGA